MLPRARQVIRQTKARLFHGDSRSEGKIGSLFEPSAEVIRTGSASKPIEFGKLVKLQEAENQTIADYEVFARPPTDMDRLIPAIEVHPVKLNRCRYRGDDGMQRWVGLGVIADNVINVGLAIGNQSVKWLLPLNRRTCMKPPARVRGFTANRARASSEPDFFAPESG